MAVKLLTIGEFARASRLSPKALRLYDELGLLRPHAVDKLLSPAEWPPRRTELEGCSRLRPENQGGCGGGAEK
ncbi:MAG: MerR family DNA-binding transcriptional regulator [Trebonia sp.]